LDNPILVEVTRGPLVESRHRGAVAVVDAGGRLLLGLGETGRPVFPRSAIKPMQAVPMIETGAADAFGFGDAELALACSSHSAEPEHVAVARRMLERAGLDVGALECGAHPPVSEAAMRAILAEGGSWNALHNNCSGKHAGMVATARHLGEDHRGYVASDHPVQRRVRAVLEELTGERLGPERCGIDGCSLPNWAISLGGLALGYARLVTGRGLARERKRAGERLIRAAMSEPFMVAGTGRFCTRLMQAVEGVFAKTGAEGVYCAAIPQPGIGIAIKMDDGAGRAAEVTLAGVLIGLMPDAQTELTPLSRTTLRNVRGLAVGEVRPAPALIEAAARLAS
jgi:L-asparaginase II